MKKFEYTLKALPPPGKNGGYHTAIFRVACVAREAGLEEARIVEAIRAHTKPGGRVVPDNEITDAVAAAFRKEGREPPDYTGPRVKPTFLAECLKAGRGATAEDIMRRSPVKLDWPDDEGWRAIGFLYGEDELLFIGDDRKPGAVGRSIRTRAEWCAAFESAGGATEPKFIPNPLTGKAAAKRSGIGETLRGDGCVAAYRFAVAESDAMSLEDQLAFWAGCPSLAVAMLTFSGSKSIHALLRVDCADAAEWDAKVAGELFPGFLVPLGMDAACKNPARLSRMPGHFRTDKLTIQRCLYLAPEGKAVAA